VKNLKYARRHIATVVALCAAGGLAACGSSSNDSGTAASASPSADTTAAASTTQASKDIALPSGAAAAATLLAKVEQGTSVEPDVTPRKVAAGKTLVLVANGMNQPSTAVTINAAADACKKIGWKCSILDGKSDPTQYAGILKQAIVQKPDGILEMGIDCSLVSQPLKQAKQAGIKVVAMQAFDCDEPSVGGQKEFDATPAFPSPLDAKQTMNYRSYVQLFGATKAAEVLKAANNKPNAIVFCDREALVVVYICDATSKVLKTVPGAKVAPFDTKFADLGPALASQVSSALLKNPDANAIVAPHGGATLVMAPAVQKAGRGKSVTVVGSEGLLPELDMIRAGLVKAVVGVNTAWIGWAGVDTINSVFSGTPIYNNGIGWLLVDKANVPPAKGSGLPESKFPDYQAAYAKAWGVS
jgi:ribose transport system substrate-binding protein